MTLARPEIPDEESWKQEEEKLLKFFQEKKYVPEVPMQPDPLFQRPHKVLPFPDK